MALHRAASCTSVFKVGHSWRGSAREERSGKVDSGHAVPAEEGGATTSDYAHCFNVSDSVRGGPLRGDHAGPAVRHAGYALERVFLVDCPPFV